MYAFTSHVVRATILISVHAACVRLAPTQQGGHSRQSLRRPVTSSVVSTYDIPLYNRNYSRPERYPSHEKQEASVTSNQFQRGIQGTTVPGNHNEIYVKSNPFQTAKSKLLTATSVTEASDLAKNGTVIRESGGTPESTGAQSSPWIRGSPEKLGSTNVAEKNEVAVNLTDRNEAHLHLGPEETMDCVKHTSILVMPNKLLQVHRYYRELNALSGSVERKFRFDRKQLRAMRRTFPKSLGCEEYTDRFCCALRVSVPTGLYVAVEVLANGQGSYINLHDPRSRRNKRVVNWNVNVTQDNMAEIAVFLGSANVIDVLHLVGIRGLNTDGRFLLRFQALAEPGLQVRMSAVNKGVVLSPLHQVRTLLVTPLFDHRAQIRVPPGHVIMVSSPTFEVMRQCVTLYAGEKSHKAAKSRRLFHGCYVHHVHVAVYNTPLLQIHLHEYEYHLYPLHDAGFQLNFSFHDQSAVPVQLADKAWNCSVPDRSLLLHHLRCNMKVQCEGGADEADCTYTTDLCGPGYLTLGGACFFYLRRPEAVITDGTGAEECSVRGGRLAVVNTAHKWSDVLRVLYSAGLNDIDVFVGIRSAPHTLPSWYRTMYQWSDGTSAFYLNPYTKKKDETCKRMCGLIKKHVYSRRRFLSLDNHCSRKQSANILCEKIISLESPKTADGLNGSQFWPQSIQFLECPLGHFTHTFLACDVTTVCWSRDHSSACETVLTPLPPSFKCTIDMERVPYTLVCDSRGDCADGSDENFCSFPPCRLEQYSCGNGQCISSTKTCDGWKDCHNGEDEDKCIPMSWTLNSIPPPAQVNLSDNGHLVVASAFTPGQTCPHTHFLCPDNTYCLPLVLRCNGVYDCPGRGDEAGCDTCPGFYRCRASQVCLHSNGLCDGHAHCPQHDDEVMCATSCPPSCVCRGLAFFCKQRFTASIYPLLRFLEATGSDVIPAHLSGNQLLIHLTLAKCGLKNVDGFSLPNLLSLDIRDNRLRSLHPVHLVGLPQLRTLSVAGNPLTITVARAEEHSPVSQLRELDLSRVVLPVLDVTWLSAFPQLHVLNLSSCGLRRVQGAGFYVVEQLRVIDVRGCPMTWLPRKMFQKLSHLQAVRASNFRMCCPAMLPSDFNVRNCFAPFNEISSCDDLLRETFFRVCVFVLSVIAIAGNGISFIFRTCFVKRENRLGYGNFVTHLSVSDFLMGVYLAIIGVADQVYRGTYVWNDVIWKHSTVCKLAGFLSLLSSEVSALIMCLITMDRFLVLRFPFSRVHFRPASAHTSSVVVWVIGMILVSVPLLPVTTHWEFYSQTGICIPLPITLIDFPGRVYSFSILIVFNFIVFVVISIGQLCIYWSVSANSMSVSNTTKKIKDLTIARRLITVAMTDFLCWFPIGCLSLMASSGVSVPGEVIVVVAIFVLPLNSAVNPCLYTVNVILERRRRLQEEKMYAFLRAKVKTCG